MIIADVLLFVRIAETLSFKDAAKHLSISRSQASKRVAALEDELGTTLIYRSPRSISLTSAGETLFAHYRRIFDMMEEARLAVEHLSNAPIGRLRFSMPTCLGSGLLPKLYSEFLPRYPGVVLDAHTSETCVDIVAGGYDVAIRVAQRLTRFDADGAQARDFADGARRRAVVSAGARHAVASGGVGAASMSRLAAAEAAERQSGISAPRASGSACRSISGPCRIPTWRWCARPAAGWGSSICRSASSPTSCSRARCRSCYPSSPRESRRGSTPCTPAACRPGTRRCSSTSCATQLLTFDGIECARRSCKPEPFMTRPLAASSEMEIPYPARAGGH